jgi:hypothetical protein
VRPGQHKQCETPPRRCRVSRATHFDRILTWQTCIFAKRKQLGITLTKIDGLLGLKSELSTNSKLLLYKAILKPIWTYRIQQKHFGMFQVEDLAHDSGRTLVRAEFG